MTTLARLVAAPVVNTTSMVGSAGAGREVSGVRVVESLADLQGPVDRQLLVMSRGLSQEMLGHRLDTALTRAQAHGAAALCLFQPPGWEPSLTVRDLLARYDLGLLIAGPDVSLAELVVAASHAITGASDAALDRLRALTAALDARDERSQLEQAAAALGVPAVELTDEQPPTGVGAAILVDGEPHGYLSAPEVAGEEVFVAELGLRLLAETLARRRREEARRDELPARSAESLLSELLFSRSADDEMLARRARQIDMPVDGWHVAVRLEVNVAPAAGEVERFATLARIGRLALQAARAGGGTWHAARGSDVVVLLRMFASRPATSGLEEVRRASELVIAAVRGEPVGCFAGIGTAHDGVAGLKATAEEARLALAASKVSEPRPQVARFDAIGLHRMLIDWSASQSAVELAREQLAPLDALGDERATMAVTTLRAFLDHGSVAGAARELHLHRNAVQYRLRWIADMLGADLKDPDQRLVLHLACRLREIV